MTRIESVRITPPIVLPSRPVHTPPPAFPIASSWDGGTRKGRGKRYCFVTLQSELYLCTSGAGGMSSYERSFFWLLYWHSCRKHLFLNLPMIGWRALTAPQRPALLAWWPGLSAGSWAAHCLDDRPSGACVGRRRQNWQLRPCYLAFRRQCLVVLPVPLDHFRQRSVKVGTKCKRST